MSIAEVKLIKTIICIFLDSNSNYSDVFELK